MHLIVGARVVAKLGDVPDDVGVLGNAALHGLEDRVLRLLASDVGIGDQAASGDDGFDRRGTVAGIGGAQDGEQGFDGGPGVAVKGKRVGLDTGEIVLVDVDIDQRGGLARGVAEREAGADADDDVGGLHHLEELVHLVMLAPGGEARAVGERVAVGDGALPAAGGDDRDVGGFGQGHEGGFGV